MYNKVQQLILENATALGSRIPPYAVLLQVNDNTPVNLKIIERSELPSLFNCPRCLYNIIYIIIASEASSVTNCANLRFLVYIFIYLYIYIYVCRRTSFLVPNGPPVTRNAQTSDRPVEVQRSI